MIQRITEQIAFSEEFGRQMRFIAGPRQTGKTTLARNFLTQKHCQALYYNWDKRSIRDLYIKNSNFISDQIYNVELSDGRRWLCFDEIHKYPGWKNILKDYFDTYEDDVSFIITGSARLDLFRKSGDSLAGRYFLFHCYPLSLRECADKPRLFIPPDKAKTLVDQVLDNVHYYTDEFETLLEFSGFPEPFTSGNKRFFNRWQTDYIDRIIREDFRDISQIKDLEKTALCMHLLTSRIGSLLSINSLTNDMQCSFQTVAGYLQLLEMGYLVFRISPYGRKITRTIRKEKKVYFYDWTRARSEPARFENFVALQWKIVLDSWNDWGEGTFEMRFIRSRDGKETDFLILKNDVPYLLCEAKTSKGQIDQHHKKHRELLNPDMPFIQIVKEPGIARKPGNHLYEISASRLFAFGES